MGASITIYCLEKITDYFEFERLCHDLMSLEGYSSIEPLGGFSDKGRDAIHVSESDETTIFAYSVREDWRAKLAEDASSIHKHGHTCDQLVFITTASFTAGKRDEAVAFIYEEYGWTLQLFGVERLRVLLDVQYPQIKANHPEIFPPEFLALQAIPDTSECDHLFISSVPEDGALADWLTRKLTAEGYHVWCERFKLLGGEAFPNDVDDALKRRAFRVLGLYSQASLSNPEVMRHRGLALSIGTDRNSEFLIPLNVDGVTRDQLDRVTSSLQFISFETSWASGLGQLLAKLESVGCPRPLLDGKRVAAEAFLEKDVLSDQVESLYSNCLQIEQVPDTIYRFRAQDAIANGRLQRFQFKWAFRRVNPKLFLSFHQPPPSVVWECQLESAGSALWRQVEKVEGIWSRNLVSELLRKSLIIKCHEGGLQYCPQTHLHYFPRGLVHRDRVRYTRPDGANTFVNAVGQRRFPGSERYQYHLAPVFSVAQDLFDDFVVLVRVRIRLSNTSDEPLPRRTAVSRRKHLCKNWWNKEWLGRVLAICQYLAEDSKITIGKQQGEQIIINAMPFHLSAPIGIDEAALDQLSYERSELLVAQDDGEIENTDKDEADND